MLVLVVELRKPINYLKKSVNTYQCMTLSVCYCKLFTTQASTEVRLVPGLTVQVYKDGKTKVHMTHVLTKILCLAQICSDGKQLWNRGTIIFQIEGNLVYGNPPQ